MENSRKFYYKVDVKDPAFDRPFSELTKTYDSLYNRLIISQDENFTLILLT